jgi:transposase
VIAHFAAMKRLGPQRPAEADRVELRHLLARRLQLIDMAKAEKQREARAVEKTTRRSCAKVLRLLKAEIDAVERAIGKVIDGNPAFAAKEALLKTIPGVGDVVARTLIAELPELGTVDRHRIAALTGLAPVNNDSGRHRGQWRIKGGRLQVRTPLYMACLSII